MTKDKLLQLLITALASLFAAGSGSYAVNSNMIERITKVEVEIEAIRTERDDIKADRDELKKLITDGQLYLRDVVMPALNTVQTDVAVLKSRP